MRSGARAQRPSPPAKGPMRAQQLGRLATLAIIPVMLLAIVWARDSSRQPSGRPLPPPEGTVLVATLREPALVALDVGTGGQRSVVLPGAAHELLIVGDRVYVTLGRADLLAEVQLPSLALLRTLRLPGEPHGIAWWEGQLAVSLDRAEEVVAIDPVTLAERRRWRVGETPHALASFAGDLFVAESRSGTVRRIGEGVVTAPGGMPESVAVVGSALAAALTEAGALAFVPLAEPGAARIVPVGPRPVRVADLGEGLAAVALSGSGQAAVYRVADGELVWRVRVGQLPDGLCRSPDGRYLAVTATGDDRLLVLDVASGTAVAEYAVRGGPGACLWVGR
ncbi:hypothetical protein HRbin29_01101 [bacterium HR29]|jgi:DNA-binding beta-propeller fold protein YncE|nr:hypothetical protein HRbin29_01101 [bacterium HR29]